MSRGSPTESPIRRAARAVSLLVRHPKQAYRALYAATDSRVPEPVEEPEPFRRAMSLLTGLDVSLTFERNGITWTIPPGQDGIGEELFEHGVYSGDTLQVVLDFVAAHRGNREWIIDVGANIGSTTVPFARAGYNVVAVEPVPTTLRYLRANIEANDLSERVRVVEAAIAAGVEAVTIAVSTSLGNSEVVASPESEAVFERSYGRGETITVPALGVGQIAEAAAVSPDSVALVWSDTQGSEVAVIETGAELWKAGVPLFAEFWLPGLETKHALQDFIACAQEHFVGFIDAANGGRDIREALAAARGGPSVELATRPVTELDALVEMVRMYPGQFTDILLMP